LPTQNFKSLAFSNIAASFVIIRSPDVCLFT
jgi:hypothetical protein